MKEKRTRRWLSLLLTVVMVLSLFPTTVAYAAETEDEAPADNAGVEIVDVSEGIPADLDDTAKEMLDDLAEESDQVSDADVTADEPAAEEPAAEPAEEPDDAVTYTASDSFYKIVHLDCGRKYFSKDWIIALINEMAADGYNQLQLAFGNDGLRFLLDDMSFEAKGTAYSHDDVVLAVESGNASQNNSGDKRWLTEEEMDEIIAAAKNKGIEIVPLLNLPGHANTILDIANDDYNYSSSSNTLDVTNKLAVEFAYTLFKKYVNYFADKGCKFFNFGADEFANDIYTNSFAGLSQSEYNSFVSFINKLAGYIKKKDMTPRAFNDGLYYGSYSNVNIDTAIQCCYWSSGWGGYDVASASTIADKGHGMINTNGDFYYVLGKSDKFDSGYSYASKFSNTKFMGSIVSDPAGSMFCIWCDYPNAESETEIAENVRLTLRAMATRMDDESIDNLDESIVSGGFNADGSINTDSDSSGIAIQKDGKTVSSVSVKMGGTVKLSLSDSTVTATWSSSDENVATVSAVTAARSAEVVANSVTVNPVGEGTATITATLPNGTELTTGVTVTTAEYDEVIELEVGQKKTVTDTTGNYESSYTGKGLDTSTAMVTVSGSNTTTDGSYAKATSITSGKQYLITIDGNHVVTNTTSINGRNGYWSGASGLYIESVSGFAYGNNLEQYLWTITESDSGYTVQNANGKYLNIGSEDNNVTLSDTAQVLTITDNGDTFDFSKGNYYLNNFGGSRYDLFASSWENGNSGWTLYEYTPGSTAGTTITFEGVYPGTTHVEVGEKTYEIVVSPKTKNITIILNEGTVTDTQTRPITEEPEIENNSIVSVAISGAKVTFTGLNVGRTTVAVGDTIYNVKVSDVDLSTVEDLTIEYWITNGRPTDNNGNHSYSVSAETAYSEDGVDITTFLPANPKKDGRTLEYWWGRFLDKTKGNNSTSGNEEQTEIKGDDDTQSGSVFTKVRYWGGKWQVFTTEWVEVTDNHQLVAYYMEVVDIKNSNGESELHINAADWGTKGDGSGDWGYNPEPIRCSVSVQIVYEDGTTNPAGTTANNLKSKTFVYGYWSGGRGLGTMIFNGQQNYQIYKVTAETGDMSSSENGHYVTVTELSWDGNEETVWEGDATQSVSISNTARKPSYEEPYDNLAWDMSGHNQNNAILIRVYVRTVATESALTVHYIDQTANREFYNYNIAVKDGTTFKEGFARGTGKNTLVNNTVENYNGVTQTVTADLSKMSEIGAQYRYSDYNCVKVERSEDGKEVRLYYTFDYAHSFVIDFGLPVTFTTGDLKISGDWTSASVSGAEFGTATATVGEGVTYTPTKVLTDVEILQLTLTGTNGSVTHQIYIYPASNVLYENDFLTENKTIGTDRKYKTWVNSGPVSGTQSSDQALRYGYDAAYAANTGDSMSSHWTVDVPASGDASQYLTTTFTGTGFDLIGTSGPNTGYVYLSIKGSGVNKLIIIDTSYGKDTAADTLYQVPLAHVQDLPQGTYEVNIRAAYRAANTNHPTAGTTVTIDGFRVYRSTDDEAYTAVGEKDAVYYNILDAIEYGKNGYKAAFVEGNDDYTLVSRADYEANGGPQNEIYLTRGQAVVLNTNLQVGSKVQVSARAVTGTAAKLNNSQAISSNTEMYYEVTAGNDGTIVFSNTGEGLLALGNLKVLNTAQASASSFALEEVTEDTLQTASLMMVSYSAAPEAGTFTPEKLDVKVKSSGAARGNKRITVTVTASADVAKLTINDETLNPVKVRKGKRGESSQSTYVFTDTVKRGETRAYDIIAYNADGVASETTTVTG